MKLPWSTRKQKLAALRNVQAPMGPEFNLPPIGDAHLKISISRNTTIALVVSLALHAIILFFVLPDLKPNAVFPKSQTLNITLLNPAPSLTATPELEPAKPEPIKPKQPKPARIIKKQAPIPKVMAVPVPLAPQQIDAAPPPKTPERVPEQATDMMALVNANRQKRGSNQAYPEPSLPMEDARDSVIKKNLAQQGTNGVFQIKDISLRTAQFTFRGWKSNYGNARLELIDVEAGPNEGIEIAIIRKMITVIRRDYSGDFHWLSPRYGDVVKSARLEDNAELEKFLMEEFFPNRSF